jgi:glycosyltransferase involved in cell wall biosynthesis
MLKDKGSSGWWRMVLPARAMKAENWRIDCTAAPVEFDSLLEYDTIFVQRIHDWESFYMLERLKQAGKYIVYDIDDDLFNITPDNPAYNTITRDDQLAAANCMKLADLVTTTTAELQRRLTGVMEGVSPLVVPNAWDVDDRWSEDIGSPDDIKRILWSGGASHGADWDECFEAVSEIMAERDDVRLMILGYLPPCIEANVNAPHFKDRIEFCGFRDPQTYYEMIHHVRAEVGLAPLRSTGFNAAKSAIKYLEYACIGVPTVASDWLPYSPVITDKTDGCLVSGKDQWKKSITYLLDKPSRRAETVKSARRNCRQQFDLKRTVQTWTELLCRE